MSTVKRFACFTMEDGVYESATGEHVSFADYERLSNAHDDLIAVAKRVAEHFADTDAPLGIAARAALKAAGIERR